MKSIKRRIGRGNKGGGNPSKPGEPPKQVKGNLATAISFIVIRGRTEHLLYVGVSKGVAGKYALYLEIGTPKGQMKARPYLRSTIMLIRDRLGKVFVGK